MQPSLFDRPEPGGPVVLRPYQRAAADAIFRELESVDSTLAVMATGTGKTVLFGHCTHRWVGERPKDRVLILAHTEELVTQPVAELEPIVGFRPELEMSESTASRDARVVCASVQSLSQPGRLDSWPVDHFGLIVWDEAHHKVKKNKTYWAIREHFRSAKHLGVTATPDRRDEIGLGEAFESVAFSYGIASAVEDGWLVPVEQQFVQVTHLDLDSIATGRDGDFNRRHLASALTGDERISAGIAAAVVEHCGAEPTIVFTCPRPPGEPVGQGEQVARWLNEMRPGSAVYLDGQTPREDRRRQLARFEAGEFSVLVGCNLFLEGFNQPKISRVVMARPTKSRALYEQAIGRGTRTLRGVLTPAHNEVTPAQRKLAIASSGKPCVVVMDFAGNSSRHKLVSCVDIFAGKASGEAKERAAAKAKKSPKPVDVKTLVAEAERELLAEAAARKEASVRATVQVAAESVDPFGYSDGGGRQQPKQNRHSPATAGQLRKIKELGGFAPKNATISTAGKIIHDLTERKRHGLCSPRQERVLRRHGLADGPVRRHHAKAMIDYLAATNWQHSGPIDRGRLSIKPATGGYQLAIGGFAVGHVFTTVADVRSVYAGLAALPAATA